MYSAKADSEHYIITPLSVKFMEFNDGIASRKNKEGKKLKPQAELDLNDYLESPSKRDKNMLDKKKRSPIVSISQNNP
jgi:hypothetical protein